MNFLFQLLACENDFVNVKNTNDIASIDVRRIRRFLFSHEQGSDLRRQTSNDLPLSVDLMNRAFDVRHSALLLP